MNVSAHQAHVFAMSPLWSDIELGRAAWVKAEEALSSRADKAKPLNEKPDLRRVLRPRRTSLSL